MYGSWVSRLARQGEELLAQGKTQEEVARILWAQRRAIGVAFKRITPTWLRKRIFARNLEKYGDELGPTIEYLRGEGKTWLEIIESAARVGGKDLGL